MGKHYRAILNMTIYEGKMTKMTMTMTMTILTMMTMCDDDGIDIVGKENMTFGFWK